MPESDQEILARVCAGDTEAFGQIVERYERALRRAARSRLGRDDWAEEAVQESFLAALKSCRTYNDQYSFRTWLWTITLNQCRAHYQRRIRGPKAESWAAVDKDGGEPAAGLDAADSPLEALLAKERAQQLDALLRRLSAEQADALRLRFFGGLKFHEIAVAMDCSLNTAKNRVRWGLLRLTDLARAAAAESEAKRQDSAGDRS